MNKLNLKILLVGFIMLPAITFAQINPSAVLTRKLQRGMSGEDVKNLQQLLAKDATIYPEGLITGYFGPLTEKAVKLFQLKNNITSVGSVGPVTLGKVNTIIQNNNINLSAPLVSDNSVSPVVVLKAVKTDLVTKDNSFIKPEVSVLPLDASTSSLFASTPTTPEHYIIRYKNTPNKNDEDSLRNNHKANVRRSFKIVPAIAVDMDKSEVSKLSNDSNILSVEVDRKIHIRDLEFDNAWGVKRIGATTTSSNNINGLGVKVAVLDTGIDYTHPELTSQYAGGYNFVSNNTNTMDDNGHGTHVAGIIAAVHNGVGVVGVSPNVKLYALKVLDSTGFGYSSSLIAAIDWAIANGIQITNNSYGSSVDLGVAVSDSFAKAEQAGIISIAAAGNSGTCAGDTDTVEYPARYDSVVAVAALDSSDVRPCFSSTGSKVELTAPGVNINSTKLGGGYVNYSGTSMATPHVTGVAALIAQAEVKVNQNPTNTSIRKILDSTATDIGLSGKDNFYGYGLVSADNAVSSILVTTPVPPVAIITNPIATTTAPVVTTPTVSPIQATSTLLVPVPSIPQNPSTVIPRIPSDNKKIETPLPQGNKDKSEDEDKEIKQPVGKQNSSYEGRGRRVIPILPPQAKARGLR